MVEKVKILLCGDAEGKFNTLFSKVDSINKKSGPFDLLLCVGNTFGINNKEFEPYKRGTKKVPIPTYILGANREEHNEYFGDEELEICPNLCYLGKRGLYTNSSGLKIAYISGVTVDKDAKEHNYTSEDAVALRDVCMRGNPNFKGVDILLTSQWPDGVTNNDPKSKVKSLNFASYQVAWLATQLRPRYHISGLEGVFYERPPYRNYNGGDFDIVTRFIGLARVGNAQKEKWIYAANLMPVDKMKISELLQKTTDETHSPYNIADLDARVLKQKRKIEQTGQQFFYNMNAAEEDENNPRSKKHKKQRIEFDQSKCWFCLASPSVEKHLVVTVGNSIYLALAKGALVDEHILICPIEHHQCTVGLQDEVLDEIERFKEALRKFYARDGKVAVFFERNFKTSHMQIQSVPVPKNAVKEMKEIFKEEADGNGCELQELDEENRLDQVLPKKVPYFTVELPTGEVLYTKIQGAKCFPINFGRDVLAMGPILNMPDRAEWKECVLRRDDEEALVAQLRTDFEPFDITDE